MTYITQFQGKFKRVFLNDWVIVVAMSILLLTTALALFLNVMQNYLNVNSVFGSAGNKTIYLLKSQQTLTRLKEINVKTKPYIQNAKIIKKHLDKQGFNTKIISEKELFTLKSGDVLLLIDAISLSESSQESIANFVKNGGNLLFNFDSGFVDENGKFTDTKMINKITSLKYEGLISRDKDNTFFLTSKLLSPIQVPKSKRLDMVLYDNIPIFSGKEPNAEFINWSMTQPIKQGNKVLPNGAIWSGKYGNGGWVYFSFPFYAMLNVNKQKKDYQYLFDSMINYLYYGFKAIKFPYLKYNKVVFISEDTEFKFQNLQQFAYLSKKYDINATAFCVGRLAEKYPALMKEVGKIKTLEIGSHSYSHTNLLKASDTKLNIETNLNKKLLEKLTNKKVVGFRPPREQTDKKLLEALSKSHFTYLMAKNIGQLDINTSNGMATIPRIGTDDYAYLIQLDWDKDDILKNMIQEMEFVTQLNGIYTLSVHTHLMSYQSNITILKNFYRRLKKEKMPVLKGKDIVKLTMQRKNIDLSVTRSEVNFIVKIKNDNYVDVKNFTFRLYINKNIKVESVRTEFSGLEAKILPTSTDDYIDVRVKKLKHNTNYNLFLKYK